MLLPRRALRRLTRPLPWTGRGPFARASVGWNYLGPEKGALTERKRCPLCRATNVGHLRTPDLRTHLLQPVASDKAVNHGPRGVLNIGASSPETEPLRKSRDTFAALSPIASI
jgi:hypothetical protein